MSEGSPSVDQMLSDMALESAHDDLVNHLRTSNARLARQLSEAKVKTSELSEAVFRAAADAASGLQLPATPPPPLDLRQRPEEVAVAVLSDWQLAKVTPSYNSDVCEQRVKLYAKKVIELTKIQRADHPVRNLRVWIVGDLLEGELIFPGQSHLIDASLYRQVVVDGPRILTDFLRSMLAEFDSIHVTAVIGNHGALGGRSRRDYNPTTNADRMVYRISQQLLANESRITWTIPDQERERDWYAIDRVGAKSAMLFHGDQVRGGFAGMPWYGFNKKVLGWSNGAIREPFDYAICGHWHQATSFPLNNKIVYVNGSTESDNTYAAEQLAAAGRPSQWLFFMHPVTGITAEYRVWLDGDDQPR